MAITITTDMLYTRAGEVDESNVISAHNPLILEFNGTNIAGAATATVQFVVKNNAGSTIYTSSVFDAYLLSGGGGATAYFYFDASEIIKHIIENYFYKELTNDVISPENYGSEIDVIIKTYDAAVLEDTDTSLEYFACHGLNQIGDEYGANIPRIAYNDSERIAHFLGFPDKLFFYSPDDLVAETPIIEILPTIANLLSLWINDTVVPYDTFTVSTITISSAIILEGAAQAYTNTFGQINAGESIRLVFTLTLNSGQAPSIAIDGNDAPVGNISNAVQSAAGANTIILTAFKSVINARIRIYNSSPSNFATNAVHAQKLITYSEQGLLGLYMHCVDLFTFKLTKDVKQVRILYDSADPTLLKQFDIDIFDPCLNGVYIRYLNKNGVYSYWMFPGTKSTTKSGSKIGDVINSFSEMATANSRNINIGYRDSFDKISVISPSVPIEYRRKLIELFTSPAVYLWKGKQTPNENLFLSWTNVNYDTFSSDGTVIISAIETGSAGSAYTDAASAFDVIQGESIQVIIFITLNSGAAPTMSLLDAVAGGFLSNVASTSAGFNILTFVATATATVRVRIRNVAASNFSTGKIVIKRAEVETDWILLEGVEGSHNILEKKGSDNFECTLVLPENYTQKLSGQNL